MPEEIDHERTACTLDIPKEILAQYKSAFFPWDDSRYENIPRPQEYILGN